MTLRKIGINNVITNTEFNVLLDEVIKIKDFLKIEEIEEEEVLAVPYQFASMNNIVITNTDNELMYTGNNYGQFDNGNANDVHEFTVKNIPDGSRWVVSNRNSFLIHADGTLEASGYNYYGQLGLGTQGSSAAVLNFNLVDVDNVKDVVINSKSTYLLKNDGSVWSAGGNQHGQLAIGNTREDADVNQPYFINTLFTGVKRIITNNNMVVFAIKEDGSLWVAGYGDDGEMGTGTNDDLDIFTDTGITGVKDIHFGKQNTFLHLKNGDVIASGYNECGQFGLSNTINYLSWVNLGIKVKKLSVGEVHTAFIDMNDILWTMGRNNYGQLGLGDNTTTTFPVSTGIKVREIFTNTANTLIIKEDESVWITGSNYDGQLGIGSNGSGNDTNVFINTGFFAIWAILTQHSTYIIDKTTNKLHVSGVNTDGQLGIGSMDVVNAFRDVNVPVKTFDKFKIFIKVKEILTGIKAQIEDSKKDNLERVRDFNLAVNEINRFKKELGIDVIHEEVIREETFFFYSLSESNVGLIDSDGNFLVTGNNYNGQLGLGDTYNRNAFTDTELEDVLFACIGEDCVYAVNKNGELFSTGLNDKGQLGLGDVYNRSTFTNTGVTNVHEVYSLEGVTYLIKTDNSLWAVGDNGNGQLGLGHNNFVDVFTEVLITDVRKVVLGNDYTLLLTLDGDVYSIGDNRAGQLGLGHTNSITNDFVKVDVNDVADIVLAYRASFIIKEDGSVWGCGNNGDGLLGLDDYDNRSEFINMNINGSILITNYNSDSLLIIKPGDVVWSTGYGYYGQLGLGDEDNRNTFTDTGVTGISSGIAGDQAKMLQSNSGGILVTGYNDYGQLGLGDSDTRYLFTNTGLTSVVSKFMIYYNTFVIKDDGSLWVTGENYTGQLGLGHNDEIYDFTRVPNITVKSKG